MREAQAAAETAGPAGLKTPRALLEGNLARACVAEMAGTFILVFLGCGVVHAAVLAKAQSGLFEVAIVWGIGVALAIHATAAISGAHVNPAMTAAFAFAGRFPKRHVIPYWAAQVAGGFLAAAILHAIFGSLLASVEAAGGITRGAPGSELTAMCYCEYFPNPALGTGPEAHRKVTELGAFFAELIGTGVLAFVVFSLSEQSNTKAPGSTMTPALVGLTVAALISVIAPLTQACFNPARDFGPRIFVWLWGWGSIAIPGPRGGFFTVYILAPILGALIGAAIYRVALQPSYPPAEARTESA
jgi:glycerol uptake facilitator protein